MLHNITIRQLLYCFKNTRFTVWYNEGDTITDVMNWETCWKYARDRKILDRNVTKAFISMIDENTINIFI